MSDPGDHTLDAYMYITALRDTLYLKRMGYRPMCDLTCIDPGTVALAADTINRKWARERVETELAYHQYLRENK